MAGIVNASLIGVIGIAPSLATLDTLFLGQSAQQPAFGGGQTIYLTRPRLPFAIGFVAHGAPLGLLVPAIPAISLGTSRSPA